MKMLFRIAMIIIFFWSIMFFVITVLEGTPDISAWNVVTRMMMALWMIFIVVMVYKAGTDVLEQED